MAVHVRELAQGLYDSEAYEVIDGDVGIDAALFQSLLGLFAQGLQPPGVSSEHMCELGRILQRVVHALCDELAHIGELDDVELLAFALDVGVGRLPGLEVAAPDCSGKSAAAFRGRESAVRHHCLGESGKLP